MAFISEDSKFQEFVTKATEATEATTKIYLEALNHSAVHSEYDAELNTLAKKMNDVKPLEDGIQEQLAASKERKNFLVEDARAASDDLHTDILRYAQSLGTESGLNEASVTRAASIIADAVYREHITKLNETNYGANAQMFAQVGALAEISGPAKLTAPHITRRATGSSHELITGNSFAIDRTAVDMNGSKLTAVEKVSDRIYR